MTPLETQVIELLGLTKKSNVLEVIELFKKIIVNPEVDVIKINNQMNKQLQTVYINKSYEEENTYLKAEFEANKDKVYTQEEVDKIKGASYWEGWSAYGESL